MKTNLKIIKAEESPSANGKMIKLDTNDGKIGCFTKEIFSELLANVGKVVSVEVVEKGKFKNIIDFYGPAKEDAAVVEKVPFYDEKKSKQATMVLSYVKDLCVAGKIELVGIPNISRQFMALIRELETI